MVYYNLHKVWVFMFQLLKSIAETEIHFQNMFSTMVEIKIHLQKKCIS